MLELRNITKTYPMAGEDVQALKGVSLSFRRNEFVSILGPSGCGKTTMLNIIGGLDKYTDGDLVIGGVSTKQYRDRDWDAYRNHSIGFVFQSYNLIPHQTVLQNVELALTLAGVSKRERRKRAREALEKVGLGDQLRKKPAEMSGGQMQRVAIARAIVNSPDIVLADEPTGALDTETSVQVLDILKEIASDRLVIMVTHNPELAEKYSTRIVRMLDGKITSDSRPLSDDELEAEAEGDRVIREKNAKKKHPSMSLFTSFGLSLKNLMTKKGRTALTSFAGSIGIVGIALIYSVSYGMTQYINSVQEETLTSYPITIEATHVDASSLLTTFMGRDSEEADHEEGRIYQKDIFYDMIKAFNTVEERENDLRSFKAYVEEKMEDGENSLASSLSGIKYTYSNDFLIYTKNVDGKIIYSNTRALMTDLIRDIMGRNVDSSDGNSSGGGNGTASMSSMMGLGAGSFMQSSTALWRELLPGSNGDPVNEVTKRQYKLVYGTWPSRYDEIVLFTDRNSELNDLTLYALGLKPYEEIEAIAKSAIDKVTVDKTEHSWTYEEICDKDYRVILNSDCYNLDELTGTWSDLRETEAGMSILYDNALVLHVTGIVMPDENAVGGSGNGAIGYTSKLTEYIINKSSESDIAKAQKETPGTDVFTGLPFRDQDADISEKADKFREYIGGLSQEQKAMIYARIASIPSDESVLKYVTNTLSGLSREEMEAMLTQAMAGQTGMDTERITAYVSSMSDEDFENMMSNLVSQQYKEQYAQGVMAGLMKMTPDQLSAMLDEKVGGFTDEESAKYHDSILSFSNSTYEDNLRQMGCIDLDSPATINLYASTFADKDTIQAAIDEYNKGVEELKQIQYTDYVGLIMSSVTTIINAISYVLIAFVSVSLIVSSIMIGVITLISVQERTKEIGILRAIGASKKNVSGMFNAETVMIGFMSGVVGVVITYLLCIPINAILHKLTGITHLNAILPPVTAAILIGISVLLTLIAGIIPSRSAAKKDPVVALRTE